MRALVDIQLFPDTDFDKVSAIIQTVNDQLVPQHPEIVKGPNVMGILDKGNGMIAYRVIFYTLNGEQYLIQNLFLKSYMNALMAEGIQIPTNPFTFTAK